MNARLVLLLLVLGMCSSATACSIVGLEHEVKFEPSSATPSSDELRKLVDWYIDKRDGPQGVLETTVYSRSRKGSAASAALTGQRTSLVMGLIKSLNETKPVPLTANTRAIVTPRSETYDTVVVGTQPVCAKTQSCCGGPVKP